MIMTARTTIMKIKTDHHHRQIMLSIQVRVYSSNNFELINLYNQKLGSINVVKEQQYGVN